MKLFECRVQQDSNKNGFQVILQGNPVAAGAVPPTIKIGGETPTSQSFSKDAQIIALYIQDLPKAEEATIDYGFTKSQCAISSAGFRDKILFWRVTTDTKLKKGFLPTLKRIVSLIIARIFLLPH